MECDLGRLHLAIEAANERVGEQNKFLAHLAGFAIEDKAPHIEDPKDLDDKFRDAVSMLGGRRVTPEELQATSLPEVE